jgi:hypothetical protein
MNTSKIRHCLVTLCLYIPVFCAALSRALGSESYLSFDVPGALGTYPMSVNNSMAVTGYYYVSSAATAGFLREPDGAITTFSVPDSVWTEPESINAVGDVTGFYEVVAGIPQGFVRYSSGRIVTFDPPVGFQLNPPQALPVSINDFGVIAGNYPFPLSASGGFTRSRTGQFMGFGYGDGADYETVVTGLNSSGTEVGYFAVDSNRSSFLRHPGGFTVQFVVPVNLEQCEDGMQATLAESVNANGVVAGWYSLSIDPCPTVAAGGFVRSPQGAFTLFNPPGTIATLPGPGLPGPGGFLTSGKESLSAPHRLGINLGGSIAGSYVDAEGAQHGFVRNPYGTITSFDPPKGSHTTVTGINDGGVITGFYFYDWNSQVSQGFLRLPKP